ncbi:MAG: hypothetical protein M1814_002113 [Vezdaea aestivalis]|nr:MAG: hypothetical protein M1814_002113 [Vezdaea aestivalis]
MSLFGNLNTGNQSRASPNSGSSAFFGSSQPPKAPTLGTPTPYVGSSTLFDIGGTSSNPPPTTSLFGTLGAQAQQPTQLPSQQSQAQQQQQGTDQAPQPSNARPAYFDGLLERGRQRQFATGEKDNLNALPDLQLGLGDISRKARELAGTVIPGRKQGDSRAHYLLAASGIAPGAALHDLKDFNTVASTAKRGTDEPSRTVDVDAYVANLHARTSQLMIEEALATSARDFDRFLEENVTMDWDEQRRKVYEHFGLTPRANTGEDRAGLKESGSFGRSRRQARSQSRTSTMSASRNASRFGKSTLGKSVLGKPGVAGQPLPTEFADVAETAATITSTADRFQQQRQQEFAEQVRLLNETRSAGRLFPLLHSFGRVEEKSESDQGNLYVETYKALIQIVKEKPQLSESTERGAIPERFYADMYLRETEERESAAPMRKRIIEGSRTYLEKRFFQNVESLIAKNPREASVGGVPSVLQKIRAYTKIRASRKDLVLEETELQRIGEDHCWVIVYYLLRSGHFKEATEYVTSNAAAFRSIDRNFATYITHFYNSEDRVLSNNLKARIDSEYAQRQRIAPENTIDPFRMACYKIVGRCDLSSRAIDKISGDMEDWMWLQFSLAREVPRSLDNERYGLEEVQGMIKEIGQRHFGKNGDSLDSYGTYFRLQIMGGMFEQAIAFLYPFSYISAVHFGIALDYYGLLRVSGMSAPETDLLSFNTKNLPQICFGRMVGYYTRDFRSVAAAPAADYLTLICLNSTPPTPEAQSYTNLCHEALRDLILETREYSTLLGDMRPDGTRIPGAIERHLGLIHLEDQEEFLRTVTVQAASTADDSGRTTDAVLLYHLAEDYENVTTILNRALSEAIAIDIGQDALRLQPLKGSAVTQQLNTNASQQNSSSLLSVEDPEQLASNMIGLYNSNAMYYRKIDHQNRVTCGVLIQMSQAKKLVANQKWAEALDKITPLGILPLEASGSIQFVRTTAQNFSSLASPIARNIGPLLMWTITCCGKQRDILRSGAYADRTRNEMANSLLTKAKDCMIFAGLIKYKLTGRVYDMLAQAAGEGGAY